MPKQISAGFIIFDRDTGAILATHPTGRPLGKPLHGGGYEMSYDIPKGHIEEGETPIQAATRELREETGFAIPEGVEIYEIGKVPYQTNKALWLFSAVVPNMQEEIHNDKGCRHWAPPLSIGLNLTVSSFKPLRFNIVIFKPSLSKVKPTSGILPVMRMM